MGSSKLPYVLAVAMIVWCPLPASQVWHMEVTDAPAR
jgi:hypothetical protein